MIVFYGLAARHRWWFVLGVVLVTTVLGTTVQMIGNMWAGILSFFVALVLCLVLALGHHQVRGLLRIEARPAAFEIVDPSHRPLLLTAGFTVFWGTVTLAERIGDLARGDRSWLGDPWLSVPAVVVTGFLVCLWYITLTPAGVRLDADGVLVRRPGGTTFVPWSDLTDLGATPVTGASVIRLGPAGVKLPTGDPDYLAWILRQYVTDRDRREAIGTPAELARILR
jgi:hypothetical protein